MEFQTVDVPKTIRPDAGRDPGRMSGDSIGMDCGRTIAAGGCEFEPACFGSGRQAIGSCGSRCDALRDSQLDEINSRIFELENW
jgi:hypothetical protein